MSATDSYTEAERIMKICNACRYCEGHCAVFPAMTLRLEFDKADLTYLANLCHGCQACFHHCQYAEPHEFDVNVPRTFAEIRRDSYAAAAWPGFMAAAFRKNGLWTTMVLIIAIAAFMLGVMAGDGAGLFGAHENKFYGVISHNSMTWIFLAVAAFVLLALVLGMASFWRAIGLALPVGTHARAGALARADAGTRGAGAGGGGGGTYPDESPNMLRRRFHHLTFYGFLLCFAATCVATYYHFALDRPAPYELFSLPKLLGIVGGIGLLIGPAGLIWLKSKAEKTPQDAASTPMELAFLWMLFLTSLTGMALYILGGTEVVGLMLVIHLGAVMGLFLTMPYGKFVHGLYRVITLIAHAREQQLDQKLAGTTQE